MSKLNRRAFLKAASITAGTTILAACAPQPTPQPAAKTQAVPPTTDAQPTAVPPPAKGAAIRYHARTAYEGTFMQKQAAVFEERSGIKVNMELIPGGEYDQKLLTLVAGGELGDGWWAAPFVAFYPMVARGITLDQNPLVQRDNLDTKVIFPGVLQQMTIDGKLVGLPQGAHPGWTSMYTNLDAWKEAGNAEPKWEWTYEKEWLPAVKAATTEKDGKRRFGFLFDYAPQGAYTFIKCWGGDWIDSADRKTARMNTEQATAAMMFMHDLVYQHKVAPLQKEIVPDMFANGLTASHTTGIWTVSNFKAAIKDKFKWQVFPAPAGPAGRGSFVGIDTLCINKASKNIDAVFEWHKYLMSKEIAMIQMDAGYSPSPRRDVWSEPFLANDVDRQAAGRWLEVAKPPTFPANGRVNEFVTVFTQAMQSFFLEKDNPKAKLQELNQALQDVLSKPTI